MLYICMSARKLQCVYSNQCLYIFIMILIFINKQKDYLNHQIEQYFPNTLCIINLWFILYNDDYLSLINPQFFTCDLQMPGRL